MTFQESITLSRGKRLVPADKFDRHMKRARRIDGESRKASFRRLNESGVERRERISKIKSSFY